MQRQYFQYLGQHTRFWNLQHMPSYSLTLCLLVSSADNLCKQFGTRSGLTKCRAWSGSKLFDSLVLVFLEEFFEKVDFEKKSADVKKAWKIYEEAKSSLLHMLTASRRHLSRWLYFGLRLLVQTAKALAISLCSLHTLSRDVDEGSGQTLDLMLCRILKQMCVFGAFIDKYQNLVSDSNDLLC